MSNSIWCLEVSNGIHWHKVRNENGHIITYATEDEADSSAERYGTRFHPAVRVVELPIIKIEE